MRKRRRAAALLLAGLATGCGGGGGDDTGAAVSRPDPVSVTAGPPQTLAVGEDPLLAEQWHLHNRLQPGEDVNLAPLAGSYRGAGVRVAIIDDGLELGHEDLWPNIVPGASHDYVDGDANPDAGPHRHGTSVAGIVGARDENAVGGRGVAPRASLIGYNLLQQSTVTNEADALTRNVAATAIATNSWGGPNTRGLQPAGLLWRDAIAYGLEHGRGGRGTIYTWAAGNGGPADNANYDGYTNHRGVIAVAALKDDGRRASYAEPGANIWISAPGGEFCDDGRTITTTDRSGDALGYNVATTAHDYDDKSYTRCFNGTSAATPSVAGVIALMLEANPTLGWRDVRLILAETARQNDVADSGWQVSATVPAYRFNHKYGFGAVDAQAAVARALTWTNVGPARRHAATSTRRWSIPDNSDAGLSDTVTISDSGITAIEFVEIAFSSDHTYTGDLEIILTSPNGAESLLSQTHACVSGCGKTSRWDWTFGSARHLGEAADGDWRLTVADKAARDTGAVLSWGVTVHGR